MTRDEFGGILVEETADRDEFGGIAVAEPIQDAGREARKAELRAQMAQPAPLERDTAGKAQMAGAAGMADAVGAPLVTLGRAKESVEAAVEANRGIPMDREERGGMALAKLVSSAGRALGGKITGAARDAEQVAAQTPGNELAAKAANAVGSGVGSMPFAIVPGVGPVAGVLASGAQSYEGTRREVVETLTGQGVPEDVANRVGHNLGMSSGLITGTITAAFNKFGGKVGLGKGVERTLGDAAARKTAQEILKDSTTKAMLKALMREAAGEGAEEATDQALQEAIVVWQYQPDRTLWDAVQSVAEAGALGAVAGGVVGGGPEVASTLGERRAARAESAPTGTKLDLEPIEPAPVATETDPRQAATDAAMKAADESRRKAAKPGKGMYRTQAEAEAAKAAPIASKPAENAGAGSIESAQEPPAEAKANTKAKGEESQSKDAAQMFGLRSLAKSRPEFETAIADAVQSAANGATIYDPESDVEWSIHHHVTPRGDRVTTVESGGGKSQFQVIQRQNGDRSVSGGKHMVFSREAVLTTLTESSPTPAESKASEAGPSISETAEPKAKVTAKVPQATAASDTAAPEVVSSGEQPAQASEREALETLEAEGLANRKQLKRLMELRAKVESETTKQESAPIEQEPTQPPASPADLGDLRARSTDAGLPTGRSDQPLINFVRKHVRRVDSLAEIRADEVPVIAEKLRLRQARKQVEAEAAKPSPIAEVWSKHNSDDQSMSTPEDVASAVEELVAKGEAPESLKPLVENYRKASESGKETGFRMDYNAAEEAALMDAVEREAAKSTPQPKAKRQEKPKRTAGEDYFRAIEQAKDVQSVDRAMGALMRNTDDQAQFERARKLAEQRRGELAPEEANSEGAKARSDVSLDQLPTAAQGAINAANRSDKPGISKSKWRQETVSVESLKPGNEMLWGLGKARFTPRKSMTKGPLVVDAGGEVVDGNNRLHEAIQRGDTSIEIYREIKPAPEVTSQATPPEQSGKPVSYEDWAKQYREAFRQSMKYSPDQVGSSTFTEKMAKLADEQPAFLERLEREEEAAKPKPSKSEPAAPQLADPNDKPAMAAETLATFKTMLADTNARLAAQGQVTDDRLEQRKREIESAIAELEKPAAEAQVATQGTTNEDIGQPGPRASGMDVREPAGTGAGTQPDQPVAPASGPEAATGAPVRGETAPGGRAKRGRGVRGGNPSDPGASGRTGNVGQPAGPAAVEGAGSGLPATGSVTEAPKTEADKNHVLPRDADWIPNGSKARVRANLDAIRLLKQLESEQRNPTPEEKAVLAQYVGWGGLKEVFDDGKAAYRQRPPWSEEQKKEYAAWEAQWGKLYDAVNAALTPEELAAASKSILNAHYTSREVINPVWKAVIRLGFRGGKALEPSAGIGHFMGLTPESIRAKTQWSAVELDDISSRILAKLYPEAKVQGVGFQDARLALNSQDLVISNVPFAKDGPIDKRYPRFSLHNYFFARALDLVKPGGIVAFITSDSTLDSASSRAAREYLAERADLIGAMRLPNTAFKRNAGTEVTTDVIFLRKRDNSPFAGQRFLRTETTETYDGKPIEVNEYFIANRQMLLGRLSLEGTMYRADQPALLPTPGVELAAQMEAAAESLPENVLGAAKVADAALAPTADKSDKIGGLVFKGGEPKLVNGDGTLSDPEWSGNAKKKGQALAYVSLRETLRDLVVKQASGNVVAAELEEDRKTLNALYDAYVKRHGPVNARASQFLDEDVDFPMVLALEDGETRMEPTGKGNKQRRVTTWTKSRIFRERTIFPREAPTRVDTVSDALQVSLNFRGAVDSDYLAQLTSLPVESVRSELEREGLAFENPTSGQWETRAAYLSGMVKAKLASAKLAAEEDPRFKKHVEELEKVQPAPIAAENIGFKLGSVWIPETVIEQFMADKLAVKARVSFEPITGKWHVSPISGYYNETNKSLFGVHGWRGDELVAESLNLKTAIVEDDMGDGKKQKNPTKSLEAQAKQDQLQKLFREWAMSNPETAGRLEQIYNERYNGMVPQRFEAPTWAHYPGASEDITLREHQKAVVSRMLQNSTLLAHAVGTGKTFAITTAAMEMRRLGLARKPMVVVQNATLEQFARSFKRLYPGARVLAPNSKQRDAQNRNRTMSRIATGDWDVVIVPQSFINLMPDDPKRETAYIRDEIAKLETARIAAANSEGKRSPKAGDLQKAIDRLEERLKDLANRKVDNVLTFEQLGVDALFVDEAHAYKKLQFVTQMDNIKGLDKGASQRGFSMLMKARWIQERNQGRNVIFATGTPVSNTIAEAWTMMRYLRPDLLKQAGIENFDAFASTFGDTVTQLEMTPGGTWKPVTRFARYTNGPELIAIWRTVADVVTPEEVNLPGLPALKWGKAQAIVVKQSPQIAEYVKYLRERLEEFSKMSGQEKRENSHIPLVVFGLAKKASLDMRMINPDLGDQPGSKLNVAADQIARIWQDSTEANGAQMVFADSFQDNPDNPTFNLYEELKRKLTARGIPEGEIVILTADIKDEKRDQIFKRLNDGEIRVALGSTERMGVGVNAQEHLIALHHLDAPPRPMDVEQRNGRIMRQGNLNPEIEIISYGVENTLDAAMFQKLATKQKFINQILRGDIQGRGFEDAANEQSLTFEEQMAAFSGDKRAMEKVALENQVRQLEALKQGHFNQMRTARETITSLTGRTIPYQAKRVEDSQRLKAEFAQAFDGETYTLEAEGKRAKGRKDVVALLDKVFDRSANDTLAGASNVFGGIEVPVGEMTLNGQTISLQGIARADKAGIILPETVAIGWKFKNGGYGGTSRTGMGFFTSLASALERIDAEPDHAARSLANEQRNLRELTGFVQQPFAQDAELETAKGKLDALVAELEAEAKAQNSPMQSAEPPGGWTDADKVNPPESAGLGAQFRDPDKMAELKRQQDQAGFLTLPDFGRIIEAGRKVREALGEAGKRFSTWAAEMVRRFGNAIEGMLGAVWTRMNWRDMAARSGLSAEAAATLNRIDETAADAGTREKPAAPPVYDPDKLETWWTKAMSASARLRYFGGDDVLRAKRGLELQTAYQSAAVKKQARRLNQQLLDAAYANDPKAQRFPKWVAQMIPPERMRRFLRYALPIAAHLNVTGGVPGAWTFDDFDMRAGFLSAKEANREGVREGDDIYRANPITGEVETLTVGKALKLDDGRVGFQVDRPMPADVQVQIYEAARAEFPEFTWLLDQYVDPALANASEEYNGVRVPAFNRFALATAYRAADPTFAERPAYTPDVSVSGAWGALRRYRRAKQGKVEAALNAGTVSPGRKYDTGESRERGFTQDLISGFNVRAFQVLQEQERKEFRDAILNGAESIPTDGLPEGFVTVDNAFAQLWDAVKVLRRFDDPINFPQTTERVRDDESPEYQQFFGELMKLRGGNKMLPKPLVETLVNDYATQRTDGIMRQLTGWWARNWKAGLLLMPDTFIENRTDNYLRFLMQGYRQMILSAVRGGDALAFREARKLVAGAFVNVVPGVRQAFDLNRNRLFNQFVEDVMPEEVFGGQTRLVDLGLDQDSSLDKLKRGEVGPAVLEATGYGKIDVAAKQQFAFALIQARAEADAQANGLRGEEAEAYVAAYVLNPPQAVRLNAVEAANKALLNYADTPHWLAKFARNPLGNLAVAFPLYRYHFIGREIDRATAAFRAFYNGAIRGKQLSPAQRQAALADSISYVTLPLLGYSFAKVLGALADSVIRDRLPEDDDEREFVGTSNKTDVDPITGDVRRKALPREVVTANRLNLSAIARQAGADTGPDDLWWHYKDYPIIRSSALLYQAIEDARRLGPGQGMKTLFNGTTDLLTSLAGTGQGVKVAGRLSDEMAGEGDGTTALAKLTDPYGARVPTSAYLTLQALNLVPFNRQADEVLKWLDPTRRRITGSKSLGYEPGVAEAVKLGGVTGLAAELTGQREGLPAAGPINRKFGFVERPTEISLAQRIAAALGQNVKPVNREQYREALAE